jgi:hypothetical protein
MPFLIVRATNRVNGTELSLVGSAHPTVDKRFRPFARVDFTLFQ